MLVEGTDYDITYPNSKKVGEYTAKLTFKDFYKGEVDLKYTIVPEETKVKKVIQKNNKLTVKWKKVKNINGYEIQYGKKSNFKKAVTVNAKKKDTKAVINKVKAKKNYFVRIRTYKKVNENKYYSNWSKAVKSKK